MSHSHLPSDSRCDRTTRVSTALIVAIGAGLLFALGNPMDRAVLHAQADPPALAVIAAPACGAFSENFDSVTAPALPAGWTMSTTGTVANSWTTNTTTPDTAPNRVFAGDPNNVSDTMLVSPVIAMPPRPRLTFRNSYNTENGFDGGVLELSVNGGAYQDVIAAGGSFITGGYTSTISPNFNSPIAGRQAWSGNSSGYLTTMLTLPATASGQNVQLRWRMATDLSVAATGWAIDTITLCFTPKNDHDFDGDMKGDVFWRHPASGQDGMWLMNGLTIANSSGEPSAASPWDVVGTGDFDNDGRADLLWRNPVTGEDGIWLMNGFTVKSSALIPSGSVAWNIVGVGDFDGDGKTDILWRNPNTGENGIWLMDGLLVSSSAAIPSVGAPWIVAGVGDFDADGKADILWRNPNTGADGLWLMNGLVLKSFASIASGALPWVIRGVADFNADGRADILWNNPNTGENGVWLMSGFTVSSSGAIPSAPSPWQIAAIADYDGDGNADLFWRNPNTGENGIWEMSGATIKSSAAVPSASPGWFLR